MARVILILSLIVAFIALRGWPDEPGVWIPSLVALAAVMLGIWAMVIMAPPAKGRPFTSARSFGVLDQLTRGLCLVIVLATFYLLLVVLPPASHHFCRWTFAALGDGSPDPDSQTEEPVIIEADGGPTGEGGDFEISTLYDPQGAVVPSSANLGSWEMAQVSLKSPSAEAAKQLQALEPLYLHAYSHQSFDGERWTSPRLASPRILTPKADGWIDLQELERTPVHRYTILHHRKDPGSNTLNALQGVHAAKVARITQQHLGAWMLPARETRASRPHQYMAMSSPLAFEDLVASRAAMVPGEIDPIYLSPASDEDLRQRIGELVADFPPEPTLEGRLLRLQNWFDTSFKYARSVDYAQDDRSGLEGFLDDAGTREGFCVHFASAAVLLLREMGVPARISYGWMSGQLYPAHHQFVFRGEHAHAWAEIYLKDHGWVVFDTTPSSGSPTPSTAAVGEAPPRPDALPDDGEPIADDEGDFLYLASETLSWGWVLLAFGGVLACLFALVLVRQKQVAGHDLDCRGDVERDPPGYLQLFYQACASLGHPKPTGCTLREYLEQLEQKDIPIPFAEELLSYHYQVAYREIPRDSRLEKRICRQIKAL